MFFAIGRGGKNGVIKAHSSFQEYEHENSDDDDDASYNEESESDEDDDEGTYEEEDKRSSGKSVTFDERSSRSCRTSSTRKSNFASTSRKSKARVPQGTRVPTCNLPYLIDYWHDKNSHLRVSIQVQLLSCNNAMLERVTYRVSSNQKEFVMTLPVSKYMGEPQPSFESYVLQGLQNLNLNEHKKILEWHPKSASRKLNLSEKKRDMCPGIMEFRIPLGIKCNLEYATEHDNDPYFFGHKIVKYPDGSTQLVVELIADSPGLERHKPAEVREVPCSVSVPSANDDDDSYMEMTIASATPSQRSHRTSGSSSKRSFRSTKSSRTSKSSRSGRSTSSSHARSTKPTAIVVGFDSLVPKTSGTPTSMSGTKRRFED